MRITSTRLARIATVAALPIVFIAARPVADGMTYEFVMKSNGKATGNKETVTMRGRGTYAGDDAKIEILEAASSTGGTEAFGGRGTYFIVKGGKEMFLVNPAEKSYMTWDMKAMFAGLGKAMNAVGGLMKMEMSDIRIDAQDLGAGPTVQGYPTRHIRMVQNYTMSTRVFGRTSKSRSETTTDHYIAPTLRIANPFVTSSDQMAMISQLDMFNNPDYKRQMEAANAKMPKTGIPLRTETKVVTTDDKGKQESWTTIMEMVNFKAANIPASAFAIPSDYTRVEMNMAAQPADSATAGAKPNARDAAAKKLKGIFKR